MLDQRLSATEVHRMADYLSIFALLVSFASLAISIYFAKRGNENSAYDRATDLFLEIDRVFIEHPEVRLYFYGNQDLQPGDPIAPKVEAVAELILDVFEWIWRRQRELSLKDQEGWRRYILERLDSSTALCDYYKKNSEWYPIVERILRERLGTPQQKAGE
jgi:hypothetical protein